MSKPVRLEEGAYDLARVAAAQTGWTIQHVVSYAVKLCWRHMTAVKAGPDEGTGWD